MCLWRACEVTHSLRAAAALRRRRNKNKNKKKKKRKAGDKPTESGDKRSAPETRIGNGNETWSGFSAFFLLMGG